MTTPKINKAYPIICKLFIRSCNKTIDTILTIIKLMINITGLAIDSGNVRSAKTKKTALAAKRKHPNINGQLLESIEKNDPCRTNPPRLAATLNITLPAEFNIKAIIRYKIDINKIIKALLSNKISDSII